ncbi:MAG: type IV pilin-like G/H family protein [Nostocaceae cyanobacterium]|nr:type IV pilin-like G/H family protein [Nostocaceae cyanobacterium]
MKREFRAKILHILQKQQDNQGFTIIELLIVLMVIGVLSAIALPSVLSQASKAKQVEGKQYIGSLNRAQQTYYLENAEFTTSITDLGIGIKNRTEHYDYMITISSDKSVVTHNAVAIDSSAVKSYAGITYLNASGYATLALLCESDNPQVGSVQTATSGDCPTNYENLLKK